MKGSRSLSEASPDKAASKFGRRSLKAKNADALLKNADLKVVEGDGIKAVRGPRVAITPLKLSNKVRMMGEWSFFLLLLFKKTL